MASEFENERNEAFKDHKLSEERLRVAQEEHASIVAKLKSKNETKVNELESYV